MSLGVSDAALEEQAPLPTFGDVAIARPVIERRGATCPVCERDVSDTQQPHPVDADVLADPRLVPRDDEILVYGFSCDYCGLLLAADPDSPIDTPGPASDPSWITVDVELGEDDQGAALVPQKVIYA